jgi:hypothetical protein
MLFILLALLQYKAEGQNKMHNSYACQLVLLEKTELKQLSNKKFHFKLDF